MDRPAPLGPPSLEAALYRLYREFFDRAEKKRRWSLREDIPWDECNPNLDPAMPSEIPPTSPIV